MATKPPSAAQLAARERFAEMARSGVLNRKRQIAAKKSGGVKKNPVGYKYRSYLEEYATKTDEQLRYIIKDASEAALAMPGRRTSRGVDATRPFMKCTDLRGVLDVGADTHGM